MQENPMEIETTTGIRKLRLRPEVSYFLHGDLDGLGRSVALWLEENGARRLMFLSRSAGHETKDADFVQELAAQGCSMQTISGSAVHAIDVARAVCFAAKYIAGVLQAAEVLDHGQANYAAANTFLDAFVLYRHFFGLPASVLDIGVMEHIGFVSNINNLSNSRKHPRLRFQQPGSGHEYRPQVQLEEIQKVPVEMSIQTSANRPASLDRFASSGSRNDAQRIHDTG
ncbi:MAG: hypothetical protein Q9204_004461 [Flavoplaca sp. TL-2023a]